MNEELIDALTWVLLRQQEMSNTHDNLQSAEMHDKIATVIGSFDPEQQEGYRQIRVQQRFARALQLWQEFPGVLRLGRICQALP